MFGGTGHHSSGEQRPVPCSPDSGGHHAYHSHPGFVLLPLKWPHPTALWEELCRWGQWGKVLHGQKEDFSAAAIHLTLQQQQPVWHTGAVSALWAKSFVVIPTYSRAALNLKEGHYSAHSLELASERINRVTRGTRGAKDSLKNRSHVTLVVGVTLEITVFLQNLGSFSFLQVYDFPGA